MSREISQYLFLLLSLCNETSSGVDICGFHTCIEGFISHDSFYIFDPTKSDCSFKICRIPVRFLSQQENSIVTDSLENTAAADCLH